MTTTPQAAAPAAPASKAVPARVGDTPTADDGALRADVRRVGALLGESLVRQQGQRPARARRAGPRADQAEQEAGRDERTAARDEARALLAGPADRHRGVARPRVLGLLPSGQHGRAGAPRAQPARPRRPSEGGWPGRSPRWRPRPGRDGAAPARSTRWPCGPVFTAHPTEASRRSILTKLRRVADILAVAHRAGQHRPRPAGPRPRRTRRPDLADRRAAPAPADAGRRGAQRRLLPAGSRRRDAAGARRRPGGRAGRARRDARRRRPPADVRHLDRRRPRRQPERHRRGHPRRPAAAAPRRRPRRRPGAGRADRRAVVVDHRRRRVRPSCAPRSQADLAACPDRPAAHRAQRHRAVPAQAHLHEGQDRQHAPARRQRDSRTSRGATISARPSCSPNWPCSAPRCARTPVR